MEHIFTLRYRLVGDQVDLATIVDCLGEAGCRDAVVGIGQAGQLALEFTRDAPDFHGAVSSAMEDVRTAVPGAKIIEVTPHLVGFTDVVASEDMPRVPVAPH